MADQPISSWPEAGDSLLAPGPTPRTDALLGVEPDWIIAYAFSFKEAADIVASRVEAGTTSPDAVKYPVVFLYRHYLELMLKGLIRLGRNLKYETGDFPKTHRLRDLWAEFRPVLEELYPAGEKADTDTVEHCILELDKIDGGGASRYGEDKNGDPTLPRELALNLANLRDVIHRISGFLEGSYDWMADLLQLQHQADMNSEGF